MLFRAHHAFPTRPPACCGARLLRTLASLTLLLALAPAAQAQWASVRGRVTDAADDQPLPGAAVVLTSLDDGRRMGTAADGNGYFVLGRIAPGAYRLDASFVGYLSQTDTLAFDFNDRRTLELRLPADEAELGEVVVESERQAGGSPGGAGFASIRPSALARIPSPGASADLAGYLQTLPGVAAAGDRGGQLFVRGGTPTQNLVLLDGMPVFQPFHIVGFYSAFPADLVAYADVHTGGFGARYGGRLSSVIDVATRNGNKQRVAGAASLAPFLGSVRLEIPVVPERVSVLGSVRESVIERVAPDVLGRRLPYRFGDRFLKLHAFLNRTSSLSLTTLRTFDAGDVADTEGRPSQIRWRNEAYGGHYIYLPEEYPVMTRLAIFVTRMESRYKPFGARQRDASARSIGGEVGFTYYLGATVVRFGLFGQSHRLSFALAQAPGRKFRQIDEFLTEGGLYFDTSTDFGERFHVEPGLRLHSFPSRSEVKLEPRLRGSWRPGGRTGAHVFSAAWGLYHQEVVGLYNTRDVTDAFVSWAASPQNRDVPRAMHVLGGWQGQLRAGLTLGAEVYFKDLAHMAFAEYDDELDTGITVEEVRGAAYGLDLKLEVARPSFYGAVNYSLARVRYERQHVREVPVFVEGPDGPLPTLTTRRTVTVEGFPPPHDRRHQVVALVQVSRGPYALSLRWHFGSGLPFTRAEGFYDALTVRQADAGFRTQPGRPVLVPAADLYDARLPAYHRLDVSLERRFRTRWLTATLQAGLINAYDRPNLFNYDLFADRRVNQLPLIPSLGLNVEVN